MECLPVRVLLVEDDEDDYVLTRSLFAQIQGGRYELECVTSFDAALEAMRSGRHDIYLVDNRLGHRNGLELLAHAVTDGCKGPMIMLTGQGEREVDIEAMKAGAADYLVKGRIDASLLERSIRYALENRRHQHVLQQAHDDLESRIQERTLALEEANRALQLEIGERKRAEEALKEADRHKDEFLAMLAHELRNPLAPIRGAVQILGLCPSEEPNLNWARDLIERQVQHMARLVDDLLDVSRITRGKVAIRKERVDMTNVVERAIDTARPLIEARRHELIVSLPAQPVQVEADPIRLAQVIGNLLDNAAKYTEAHGRIWLTVQQEQTQAILTVRDCGIGIPADLLPHVFDLFRQADHSLDRSHGGLGIGLTLVKRLVEMHGGIVSAFSDGPGRGSMFVVRLPVAIGIRRGDCSSDGNVVSPRPPARRVLVVDDNIDAAECLGQWLRLQGHEVCTAHDGVAALRAASDFFPDVMLLDIGLPGMNGYEVARRLRQRPETEDVLLIAVTGYGQDEDYRRSKHAGFDHHLIKPLTHNALEKLLADSTATMR